MKKFLLFIISLVLGLSTFSQVIPNKDKVKLLFTGGSPVTGMASKIERLTGNIITCGYMNTVSNGKDAVLVKLDSNLNQIWFVQFDSLGLDDKFNDAYINPTNGDIYVTGYVQVAAGNRNAVAAKYNSSGTLQWRVYGAGNANLDDEGYSIAFDGTNVWITGYVSITGKGKDLFVWKANGSTGATLAQPRRNGTANGDDVGYKICVSGTSAFVTGYTRNTSTNNDIYVACFNLSTAALTWSIATNGSASGNDSGLDALYNLGDLYVCGYKNQSGTGDDYYFARINVSNGSIKYSDTYDAGWNGSDQATSMVSTKTGFYGVTGLATDGSSNNYYNTRMYDTSSVYWTHSQPINGSYTLLTPKISVDTIAWHFYCAGTYSNSTFDGLLYQLDPTGVKRWTQYHNGVNNAGDGFVDLVVDGLARIFVASPNETGTSTGIYDYKLIRYSQTPVYIPVNYGLVTDTFSMNHLYYPNTGEIRDTNNAKVSEVEYYTKFTSFDEYIQKNKISFCRYRRDTSATNISDTINRFDMVFQGANEFSELNPINLQEKLKLNYFYADTNGITNVRGAAELLVPNIYPMIDLHITSNGKGPKYLFVVKPTGDPNDIRLYFDGAASTATVSGELRISTTLGSLSFKKPDIYNVSVPSWTNLTLSTTSITGTTGWVDLGSDTYSINPGSYNTAMPLVIEFDCGKSPASVASPIGNMDWSTHLGGSASDDVTDLKVDNANNLYVVGRTTSSSFPYTLGNAIQGGHWNSSDDGFIAKFNNTTDPGVPQWATYIGGTQDDRFYSVDIGPDGNIYCAGSTASDNFTMITKVKLGAMNQSQQGPIDSIHYATIPKTPFYHADGMICEVNPSGDTLKWRTRVASAGSQNDEILYKCKFDGLGNLFAVGITRSPTNIILAPSPSSYTRTYNNGVYTHTDMVTDGYIVKLNTSGIPVWGTTIGASTATNSSGYPPDDILYDLAFDANNDVYVAGYTQGNNYPTSGGGAITAGQYDGVISRFDNNGVIKWSTHLGGPGYDYVYGINTNPSKSPDLFVTGSAQTGFPMTNSGQYYYNGTLSGGNWDAFLTIYSSSNARTHSTFFGGSKLDEGHDIEIDNSGVIHVSGKTASTDFYTPSPNNGYNATPTGVGFTDLFVCSFAKWVTDLLWTGVIGGDGKDAEGYGYNVSLAVDNSQQMLYLGSMAHLPAVSVQYPVLGSAPTYTQNFSGTAATDGSLSRFDLTTIHSLVGVEEIKKLSNNIFVFPNPATTELNVKILNFNEPYHYIIYNAIGQAVSFGRIDNFSSVINLYGLKTGVYFIELTSNKERLSTKFVKHE